MYTRPMGNQIHTVFGVSEQWHAGNPKNTTMYLQTGSWGKILQCTNEWGSKLAVSLTSDISTRTSQNVKKKNQTQKQTSTKKIKNHHVLPLYGMTLALGNMGKFVYTGVYFTISAAIAPSAKWQLFPTLLSQNTLVKLSKGCLQKDREQDAKAHQRSTQQLRKRTLAELMDTVWRIYNRTGSICSASQ